MNKNSFTPKMIVIDFKKKLEKDYENSLTNYKIYMEDIKQKKRKFSKSTLTGQCVIEIDDNFQSPSRLAIDKKNYLFNSRVYSSNKNKVLMNDLQIKYFQPMQVQNYTPVIDESPLMKELTSECLITDEDIEDESINTKDKVNKSV